MRAVFPGDAGYDAARRVRNARVDRRPAVVARCSSPDEVVAALGYARDECLGVAVRGGGANVAGWGTCDGGLVLDVGPIDHLRINAATGIAEAGPGLTWGRFDAGTARFMLALPGARNTGVGIAGHTLGGGVGDLSRQFGLTSDNLVHAELVTADGRQLRVDADTHPELFWALRGGGGAGLGVVTSFGFRLHPVGGVVAGPLVHARDAVPAALRKARDWLETAPDETSLIAIAWTAPPLPFIPADLQYERGALLIPTWFGDPARADEVLAPLLADPAPVFNGLRPMTYVEYQGLLQSPPDFAEQHVYNRGELLPALSDDVLDGILQHWQGSGPNYSVVFGALGGAISRAPAGETAFAHREARWFIEICAQWYGAADNPVHVETARQGWRALQDVTLGPYVNLLPDPEAEWARAAYGKNYERLVAVKREWDPDNLFRFGVQLHDPHDAPTS
ncbi:FAD-binding oxidoreductase [Kribbella sp. NBC_01245]|uniref:FAD-binding oxidoreductase n=1 Tax=Kribbella sp. NBC_01245 TaxID=2903578 RepID=UPI002E2A21CC|nr:FAD-binding oxidoreductase [Kribbella sp. NBC_01245]